MTEKEWLANGYAMGVVEPDIIDTVTFYEMYNQWFMMKSGKVKPETLDRIECTFNRWYVNDVHLQNTLCAKIDEAFMVEWLTTQITSAGNVTKREMDRIYQILHGVLTFAYDMNIKGVKLMDWERVRRYLPTEKLRVQTYNEVRIPSKDIDTLFKAVLVDDIYPLKESACLCLLLNFYLGLRVGELAALTWKDIDFQRKCLNIEKTAVKYFERDEDMARSCGMSYHVVYGAKTANSVRTVPLCDEALYILGRLKKHHSEMQYENDFLAYDGSQTVLIRSLDRTLRRLCKLCEIPVYNTHKIRKTYATFLHDSKVPIKTVSMLLGHADVTTTAKFYIKSDYTSDVILGEVSGALKNLVDIK